MSDASGPGPKAGTPADALCRCHDVLLLDLDGVVYRGRRAVAHAVPSLLACREQGARTAYVTNNASRPPSQVVAQLRELGLQVADDDVVTSAQAGARLVRDRVGTGSQVLAVGGPGVSGALQAEGLVPVGRDDARGQVVAVLVGYGPDVSWRDLAAASYAITAGAVFVATNADLTMPTERGVAPGNGSMVAAVVAATGTEPTVAGKPYRPLLDRAIEQTAAATPLVVGDRLDTDIEAARRAGLPSLLVLTGVTGAIELLGAPPGRRPTYVAADLRGLLARGMAVVAAPCASVGEDGGLQLGAAEANDPLARLRAAAAACWTAADAGRPPGPSSSAMGALAADIDRALAG